MGVRLRGTELEAAVRICVVGCLKGEGEAASVVIKDKVAFTSGSVLSYNCYTNYVTF